MPRLAPHPQFTGEETEPGGGTTLRGRQAPGPGTKSGVSGSGRTGT